MLQSRRARRIVARLAVDIAAIGGIFVAPWALVFTGIAVGSVVFRWYVEALAVGFVAGVLSGLPAWKPALAIGGMILGAEWVKRRFEPRQWFSYIPLAIVAAGAGGVIFFLVL